MNSLPRFPRADPRAGLEPVLEPCLVEPDGGDLAGLVGDARLHELEPAGALDADAQHLAGDRRLVLAEEIRDRQLRSRGLVAPGPVLERVADRPQPERCEPLLDGRPDAVQCLEPELETLRRGEPGGAATPEAPLRPRSRAEPSGGLRRGLLLGKELHLELLDASALHLDHVELQAVPRHLVPASGARPSWPKTKPARVW